MRRNDLVKEIARRIGIPQVDCERVIETLSEVVTEALVNGDKVTIRGLMTMETSEISGRNGYNPVTGETQYYKPVRIVKCRIGKPIKDAINESMR